MLFFSTTAHIRSSQQWSYKQNFLLLRYSTHLSLDVHCSSHLKKKKIFLLSSLSPHIKKTISYPLSLSGCFFFLPRNFFFLSSSPSPDSSLIPQLATQPSSSICFADQLVDLPQAPSSSICSARRSTPSSFFSLSTTPPASTSPASTFPTQVFSHLSFSPICD